jgi:phosphotransferase system IIB component
LHEAAEPAVDLPPSWIEAFGGAGNLCKVEVLAGRLRVEVSDREKVDAGSLASLDLRAVLWVSTHVVHLLCDEQSRVLHFST